MSDLQIGGITHEDLREPDEGTRRAQGELQTITTERETNATEHAGFTKATPKLRRKGLRRRPTQRAESAGLLRIMVGCSACVTMNSATVRREMLPTLMPGR